MKKITAVALFTMGFAATMMAAEFKGFVEDETCSKMPEMKGNVECAQKCIKGGTAAVLVTDDGKIYKIANQAKITPSAGKTVTVMGTLKGDTITVESVK